MKYNSRVVRCLEFLQRLEVGEPRITGARVSSRVEGPLDIVRRGGRPVVPEDSGDQVKLQLPVILRPGPGPREIRLDRERTVVAHQGREEHVALHLAGQRMDGKQRIDALEIGPGREDNRRTARRRGRPAAGDGHQARNETGPGRHAPKVGDASRNV